jgi:hypothetical protein
MGPASRYTTDYLNVSSATARRGLVYVKVWDSATEPIQNCVDSVPTFKG